MLVKLGVSVHRLKKPMRKAQRIVENVYLEHGEEAIVTSTFEGNHRVDSLHYVDLAVDYRQPQNPTLVLDTFLNRLREELGEDYDVVYNKQARIIHVEHDPK